MSQREDPAEQGYLRFFYRDWRPTRFGRFWSGAWAWVSGLGLTPQILLTLQVKDRSTGHLRANILAVARYQGQRYLVSMLGDGYKTCVRRVERRLSSVVGLIRLCLRRSQLRSARRSLKHGAKLRRVVASTSRSRTKRQFPTSKQSQNTTLCFVSILPLNQKINRARLENLMRFYLIPRFCRASAPNSSCGLWH
jgi:hypothetical protein